MSIENYITLECPTCKRANYFEHKNSKIKGRLQKSKHCRACKKHTMHKETK